MFSSKPLSRRHRRHRCLNTEVWLTIAVFCTYFIYKTVMVKLPTDTSARISLGKVPTHTMAVQNSIRKVAPAHRDMLSVDDPLSDDDKLLDFLNLGRWNNGSETIEPTKVKPPSAREEYEKRSRKVEVSLPRKDEKDKKEEGTFNHDEILGIPTSNVTIDYGPVGKGIKYIDEVHATEPVVSHHSFKYIINPEDFCQDEDLYFITYIHSAVKYGDRRNHIRRTWGNPKYHEKKFKVLFVFGANGDPELQRQLQEESNMYGDILQEDFIDTYRNLTHKGVAALKWIEKYCSHAKYVLKTDDDTFVNTFTYIRYLQAIDKIGTDTHNMILCAVWKGMTVSRKGKWGVTKQQFSNSSYPTYCSGCAFTLTMDVALAIHKISYHVPFFWVDDAYITGVLPRRIGHIKHRNSRSTYEMNSDKLIEKFTGDDWWRYIFSSDIHRFDEAEEVWDNILNRFKKG